MKIELNRFAVRVHKNAVEQGWWEEERTFGEIISLCHSELSEVLEEFRAGRPKVWYTCKATKAHSPCIQKDCGDWNNGNCVITSQPESIAVEMADCIFRILDYLGKENVDVDALVGAVISESQTD